YKLGGFILFSPNLENVEQSRVLINDLKKVNEKNNIPLFLSVDQEGGTVTRLPDLLSLLPNEEIGLQAEEELAFQTGKLLGKQLNEYGFQVNFAPVIDVNSNPDNPVIGDRTYGSDPEVVGELGVETMKGMQSEQIISVLK